MASALPVKTRLDVTGGFRRGSATLLPFNISKGTTATIQAQMGGQYVHIFQHGQMVPEGRLRRFSSYNSLIAGSGSRVPSQLIS